MSLLGPSGLLGSTIAPVRPDRLDLPSWYRVGDAQNWRTNPYQVLKISAEGQSASFFILDPPDAGVQQRIDIQQPLGKTGARVSKRGVQAHKSTITILIFTGQDEDTWDRFAQAIAPKLQNQKDVVSRVSYPSLNRYRISVFYIHNVREKLHEHVKGALSVTMEGIETIFQSQTPGKKNKAKVIDASLVMPNAFSGGAVPAPNITKVTPSPATETDLP
jgi:hypothetical protein